MGGQTRWKPIAEHLDITAEQTVILVSSGCRHSTNYTKKSFHDQKSRLENIWFKRLQKRDATHTDVYTLKTTRTISPLEPSNVVGYGAFVDELFFIFSAMTLLALLGELF